MNRYRVFLTNECIEYYTFTINYLDVSAIDKIQAEQNILDRYLLDDDDILRIERLIYGK